MSYREEIAQAIEMHVRTPPGVQMSDVTKVYLHCAAIARGESGPGEDFVQYAARMGLE